MSNGSTVRTTTDCRRSQYQGFHGCQDWCEDSCGDWPGRPLVFPHVSEAGGTYGIESDVQSDADADSWYTGSAFHACQDWCPGSCEEWPLGQFTVPPAPEAGSDPRVEPPVLTGAVRDFRSSIRLVHPWQEWPGQWC